MDHFDSDGKRYILAQDNTAHVSGPGVLSKREKQVASLAALGRSNKLIAYELGLAHSTVRVLLARAGTKLQVASRAELVAKLSAAEPASAIAPAISGGRR